MGADWNALVSISEKLIREGKIEEIGDWRYRPLKEGGLQDDQSR